MQNQVLIMTYASSLTDLCKYNSSFDTGILRIAYPGVNRNGSRIDKETFEKCLPSIYNCPIVCNYDRETDTLGGHDVDVVRNDNGALRMINVTTPVGVVPESSKIFWQEVEEEDHTVHEYLCAEVLLWKRQEAYEKIKRDGITSQSMEIMVKSGENDDGVYVIHDFEFNAFALIGVEPCFESATLEFAKLNFKQQFAQMMLDLKNEISGGISSSEDENIIPHNNAMKGGTENMDETSEVIDTLASTDEQATPTEPNAPVVAESKNETDTNYALNGNVEDEIIRALRAVKVKIDDDEFAQYWYVDFDSELGQVYCFDVLDCLLYGFAYSVNGDMITIDWESKKRKKYIIVDFEGEIPEEKSVMEGVFSKFFELGSANRAASTQIENLTKELDELKRYKADSETKRLSVERAEVFSRFEDLYGIDEFESLRADEEEYDPKTLEEKCYAIRGKNSITRFSKESKMPKLPIERARTITDEPYGGLFQEYGVVTNI